MPVSIPGIIRHIAATCPRGREFLYFTFFGTINTLITYAIYLGVLLAFSYPIAYTVSWILGIVLSYYLNARFVFQEKLRLSSALRYPLVYVSQYFLGMLLLYLLVEKARWSPQLAPILIVVISIPITYALSRYIISGSFGFKRRS